MKLCLLVICASAPAAAGTLADMIVRHDDNDVATLRGLSDPTHRCTLGAVYLLRDDLPRAAIYLAGCEHAKLPRDIVGWIPLAQASLARRIPMSGLATFTVTSEPRIQLELDDLPGETLVTPVVVFGERRAHMVRTVAGRARQAVVMPGSTHLDLRPTGETFWQDVYTDDPELMREHDCILRRVNHPGATCSLANPTYTFTDDVIVW